MASPLRHHVEIVMGTVVSFAINDGALADAEARAALWKACTILHRADRTFSTFNATSAISRLRRGELELTAVPGEVEEVLTLCAVARDASWGWFDPWSMHGGVDPTGLVKGWAASKALEVLREAGASGAMVNAGGDVATFGLDEDACSWRIGVQNPNDANALLCAVISPGAVATSGSYERGPQVLDPKSGMPSSRVFSATVVGPDPALADALATGLFAAGEEGLGFVVALDGYFAMVLDAKGEMFFTNGFPFSHAHL